MTLINHIIVLLRKDFQLEWKNKSAINGIIIYVISTVYISYLCFKQIIDPSVWNALFWIIMLFASVNAVAKSFMNESRGQQLFYYTYLEPRLVILSKTIYNVLLLMGLALVNLLFYSIFLGNIIQNQSLFIVVLLLGSSGLSSILTLISAIASRVNNNTALMAILSFPVLIPLLIIIIRVSKNAIEGIAWSVNTNYLVVLLALNIITWMLGYLLFPYLWRE